MFGVFLGIFLIQVSAPPEDFTKAPTVLLSRFAETQELLFTRQIDSDALPLPDSLLIAPGKYYVGGIQFDVHDEGRLLVFFPEAENIQRIVYAHETYTLMSSIAWIHHHGMRHDTKSFSEISEIAKREKVSATCSKAVNWAINVVSEAKISARLVSMLTLETWNGYDDGHSMLEAWVPEESRWILFDLTTNAFFAVNGRAVSFYDFGKHLRRNPSLVEVMTLAKDVSIDTSWDETGANFNYGLWLETILRNPARLSNWYKRISEVPLEQAPDGKWYFYDFRNQHRILSYSPETLRYMPENKWVEMVDAPPPWPRTST